MTETMSSRGNGTSRTLSATSRRPSSGTAASSGSGRPVSAATNPPGAQTLAPQRTSNSAIRQRVAEKKKLVEAQFLGRETIAAPSRDLPPFWSTDVHGAPYNAGDPLDIARGAKTARGAPGCSFGQSHPPHRQRIIRVLTERAGCEGPVVVVVVSRQSSVVSRAFVPSERGGRLFPRQSA